MSKILCGKSGIIFSVAYGSVGIYDGSCVHPIFSLPYKKLLPLWQKHQESPLPDIDVFLLSLAALNSTGKLQFRTQATYCPESLSKCVTYLDDIMDVVQSINAITVPSFSVPEFVISAENNKLQNLKHWIETWKVAVENFHKGRIFRKLKDEQSAFESSLTKLIKAGTTESKYSSLLAKWTASAANFPSFGIDENIFGCATIDEYWKHIIITAAKPHDISIPDSDIQELLDHLEDNIDASLTPGYKVLSMIRTLLERTESEFGISRAELARFSASYQITDKGNNEYLSQAVKDSLLKDAPVAEPRKHDYATAADYLRARAKWMLSKSNNSL